MFIFGSQTSTLEKHKCTRAHSAARRRVPVPVPVMKQIISCFTLCCGKTKNQNTVDLRIKTRTLTAFSSFMLCSNDEVALLCMCVCVHAHVRAVYQGPEEQTVGLPGGVENPFLVPPTSFQLAALPRNDSLNLTPTSSSAKQLLEQFLILRT